MASQEQLDNQKEYNDYIKESQEFLGETISLGAQLADQIKFQLDNVKQRLSLDKEILAISKQNVNSLSRLKVDYTDLTKVTKDRESILNQIQKNQNLIAAKSKEINSEDLKAAQSYVLKENSLKSQQDTLAEIISQQESLEAAIKGTEALGGNADDLYDQLDAIIKQKDAYRESISDLTSLLNIEQQRLDPAAAAVALLQDQTSLLNEAIDYLNEEEQAVINIEEAQGLFNLSLGAAEKILKKMGLESSALALGLSQGAQAAADLADELTDAGQEQSTFGDRLKVLGAGLKGTFQGALKEIKVGLLALGAGKLLLGLGKKIGGAILSPISDAFSEIKGLATGAIGFLKKKFFSIGSFMESFQVGEQLFFQLSQNVADTATSLGVGTKEAQGLFNQAKKVNREIGMLPEEVMKLTAGLNESFGSTQKFSDDTVKTVGQLVNLYGLSNQEAAEFAKLAELSGETTADTVLQYKSEIQALKARNNIALSEKEVMKEIASMSAATQLTLRGQGKSLADAAFQAKKMGLEMGKLEGMSSNLLQFEDSIAKEMEAELLIGRDLQLDKARQLALQGDLAGVAEEVASQIGSASEFGKMNVMQQEALAASVGMTRDELAKTLKTQELLANTGFDDMSSAQQEFNKLLKETGSEEKAIAALKKKGASEALTDQLRNVSAKEKEEQRQRDLVDAQYEMAMAMRPVAEGFRSILETVEDLRKIIIEQMEPFFARFGGDVGDAGAKFGELLEGPAKSFGIFLNDVGIKMLDAVESIDLDKLIADGKDFIDSVMEGITTVKTFFTESPLGALFGGSTALAGVGTAAVTLGKGLTERGSRMKPMYVKQADTGLFDMLKPGKTKPASLLKQAKTLITKPKVMARALTMKGGIGNQLAGKALGGLGKLGAKGLLKAIPGVGLIATAGMALFDAAKSAKDASNIFDKKEGEKVTTGEKVAAGAAGAVSSLTFGLLDTKNTAKVFKSAGDSTKKFFKDLGSKTKNAKEKFGDFTEGLKEDLEESFNKGVDVAKEKLSGLKDAASEKFADIKEKASDAFSGAKTFAGGIFEDLKKGDYASAFNTIKTKIVEKFTEIKGRVAEIFGNLMEPIKEKIKGPINFMIGSINSMIQKINSALSFTLEAPEWAKRLGIEDYEFKTNIPTIPALAEGGIVEKATLAMVGEAGPEAVVPLDEFTQSNEKTQQEIRELKEIMGTFVQQMAQVVNQPMVVELDGNKVGEAMGRSSFRVQ